MTEVELFEILDKIQNMKSESQTLEIKSAHRGCPEKLYDTLSSFSNQDDGGLILFGVDEKNGFAEVGVYDAQNLQKHIVEQCNQMDPIVRPLFTVAERNGRVFVSAEIPGVDMTDRPCFYCGKGRMKGSYVRVADADEPMTEYEVYSYEAFRKKYQDDVRLCEHVNSDVFDSLFVSDYLSKLKNGRPNLSQLSNERIFELMSVTKNGIPSLFAVLLFGVYPQAVYPQLCITAIVVPGTEIGTVGNDGERFIDNERIEGTLPQMLERAISFVRNNMKSKTIINESTGARTDKWEYPPVAIREAILNALIHRDYSIHTEGMPIQLRMFSDRMEIISPGGLYGKLRINQLGKVQPDTRNPKLAVAMELLSQTENRYSGIPTMKRELEAAGLPAPEFKDRRGEFTVTFYNKSVNTADYTGNNKSVRLSAKASELLEFCRTPRSRQEIADFLGIETVSFATKQYLNPLIAQDLIRMMYPNTPKSKKQKFYTT